MVFCELQRFSCLRLIWLLAALSPVRTVMVSRFPLNFRHNHKMAFKILYQKGQSSESDLPECAEMAVCNRVDTYSTPWIERQCRCPGKRVCSMSVDARDGYTVVDKNRQFKMCEPVSRLPTCRYFRDVAWTFATYPDNTTRQTMHCVCPKNSVAYILKHESFYTSKGMAAQYHMTCSPLSKMRCQRKEPCRLFTVKKRPDVEDVNTNTLCQCLKGHHCPTHHTEPSVISTPSGFTEEHIRTYSGYCTSEMP